MSLKEGATSWRSKSPTNVQLTRSYCTNSEASKRPLIKKLDSLETQQVADLMRSVESVIFMKTI